jgi:uncharacterized membrane protein
MTVFAIYQSGRMKGDSMGHIKLFDDTRVNTGRQYELDWTRGLAVLFMVLVHVKIELSGLPLSNTYSKIVEFFGSPTAAPAFMILLGTGIVYSKNSAPQKLAMRGLKLIALNYGLNLIAFGIPLLIRFFQTKDNTILNESIAHIFGIDILAFAGITFLFFALMKKIKLRFINIVLVTLVLSCLNYLLTVSTDNVILGFTAGIFVRVCEYSYFPFFAWIGYPVMGYAFANLLARCADKNGFYKYLFAVSILSVAAISLGSLKYSFDIWDMHFGPEDYYYQDFIQYILVGGICFSWISILYMLSKIRALNFIGKQFCRWSKNTTVIYFVQWLIIGWCSCLELISLPMKPLVNFITGLVVFIFSDAIAFLYLKITAPAKRE